jgi:hypothetical protein
LILKEKSLRRRSTLNLARRRNFLRVRSLSAADYSIDARQRNRLIDQITFPQCGKLFRARSVEAVEQVEQVEQCGDADDG